MTALAIRQADELLAIARADAWFEYLHEIRNVGSSRRYDDVEPWAWARLQMRLAAKRGACS